MNRQNVRILTLLSLFVMWAASAMQAQYTPHYLKVSIPFEFSAIGKSFPAGTYSLVCTPGMVELRDSESRVVVSAISHSVQSAKGIRGPRVVFETENGIHTLRQVWVADPLYGYELARSQPATAIARQGTDSSLQAHGGGANQP